MMIGGKQETKVICKYVKKFLFMEKTKLSLLCKAKISSNLTTTLENNIHVHYTFQVTLLISRVA